MTTATPLIIPEKSQEAIVQMHKACFQQMNAQWNIREQMRAIDVAYQREKDQTQEHQRAKLANSYGDSSRLQNITVPVVMPQVESAVTYQASVFLTGSPLFGWVAGPKDADAARQYQAIIEENSIRGGWTQQLLMAFRDAFKYNLAAVEVDWQRRTTPALITDPSFGTEGKPKEVIWAGNCLRRLDLYNSFWDTRYNPTEVYKHGEFFGYTELMSRVHLKKFINELPDKMVQNIKDAFESGCGGTTTNGGQESYYIPQINPNALMNVNPKQSMDWLAWASLLDRPNGEMQYKNIYEVSTLYARIIPQDFRLRVPSANTPQVWKFIIVNHSVLIYAERQTNAHGYIPVFLAQPYEDGLGYQTKSLAQNAEPFQDISSTLLNSAFAARRRAVGDRGIFNPILISESHINSSSPTAKIPLRPAGYARPMSDAYFPIPFRDDQSAAALQEIPQVLQMANLLNGQNQARQGQFVKGNKTLHEFNTVMANASGRDQTISMMLEAQFFTPIKETLKINTLQYQQGTTVFSTERQQNVVVDPVTLRNELTNFRISDGLTPTEKIISGDELAVALQTLASSPQLAQGYNLAPVFSYLMKTRNVDLSAFEKSAEQQAYEQAVATWQQTVLQLAKQLGENFSPDKLPPQPTPDQFGYNPKAQGAQNGSPSA